MNITKCIFSFCAGLFLCIGGLVRSQGFVNLDFEDAVLVHDPSNASLVYTASAIPGWTIYGNYLGPTLMLYDAITLGSAAVSIHDGASSSPPFQGNYVVRLQPNSVTHAPVAIGQTGQIPLGVQMVTFYGESSFDFLSFAGNPISLSVLGTTPNYTIYSGNIAAYAGQTGELLLQGVGRVDNFQFTVPEPSALSLFGLGALAVWWNCLRAHKG
ncbi:MAG: hypothetical protein RLY20_3486 [Verrucomicrobiota bacterium]|jgi:hypothetical protein